MSGPIDRISSTTVRLVLSSLNTPRSGISAQRKAAPISDAAAVASRFRMREVSIASVSIAPQSPAVMVAIVTR